MDGYYQISIAETGEKIYCHKDQVVLNALQTSVTQARLQGCYGGGCGVCRAEIISGEYIKCKKMSRAHILEEDEERGIVLLCCIKPQGNLVISIKENRRSKWL